MAVAIVAIPADDDDVWQVSSEKVPHLTLLFLGDQANNPKIGEMADFLKHTAHMSMTKFGLTVDHRGTLGADEADVLFFAKHDGDPEFKMVSQARDFLLENAAIKEAYNSVEQFDGWKPHLTMGYPATPAKPDTRDYKRFSWVRFDRVALWVGDYTGPEFRLHDSYADEVRMSSNTIIDNVLAHHGVKGMKWGVRKDKGHEGERVKTKKLPKLDSKFAANSQSFRTTIALHNRAAELTNKNDIDRINNKPEYKSADFRRDSPLRQQYYKEHQNAFLDNLQKAADEMGTNASGTKKYGILENPDGSWDVTVEDVAAHAADVMVHPIRVDVKKDVMGRIVKLSIPDQAMGVVAHEDNSDELVHIAKTVFSDKPWSDFKESDYDVEQWHHACLIHNHEGAPTAKNLDKLPVREPDGTFNKNGIHAAASVLAGGMGGVDATDAQKAQAARSLSRLYSQLEETLPESVSSLMHSDAVDKVLEHHGVKGMKWGVRKDRPGEVTVSTGKGGRPKAAGGFGQPATDQAKKTVGIVQKGKASGTHALTNEELQAAITRMNLEQNYARLVDQTQPKSLGKRFVGMLFKDSSNIGRQQANRAANLVATQKVNAALEKHGVETGKKKKKADA